jgi:hypothetical protein
VLLLVASAIAGRAQNPVAIRGRVIAAAGGDPLRGARVSLDAGAAVSAVLSDDEGRFEFPSVAEGRHTLAATKPGFVRTTLSVASVMNAVTIAMPRAP